MCALHCAQLLHTILHRTDPIVFPPYPPDNHHCSDDVYLREGGGLDWSEPDKREYPLLTVTADVRQATFILFGVLTGLKTAIFQLKQI